MADHTVFLVHGMGEHAERVWSNPIQEKLLEVSLKYEAFQDRNLSERIEFIPISYDDIIVVALDQWKENSQRLGEFARVNGLQDSGMLRLLEELAKQDEPFFWSHVADVLVYRLLRSYTNLIRLRVVRQIGETIQKKIESGQVPSCSVLAHSLGTAVAHDALHKLGSEPWNGGENPFGPKHWRFHHIIMIANSSRLLSSEIDPHSSIVRPGPNVDETSYCYQYHCFDHDFDLVGKLLPISPTDWSVTHPASALRHFHNWNFHAFEHYLDHPLVHIPILRAFTNKWTISRDEEVSAHREYQQLDGEFESVREQIERVWGELGGLRDSMNSETNVKQALSALQRFFTELNNLKQIAEQI